MKPKFENDEVTIISSGVVIEGKLSSKGNVRVDGTVKGDVNVTGNVTIGETGDINGQVNADIISVGGKVVGKLNAKEKVVLEGKAILKGDLVAKILVVEAGAKFDGNSKMDDTGAFTPKPNVTPPLPK
ncbi:MAG TPA: polymer-forming cytoskeletal protein [Ignavibacteriaceae bacterium]|nr:polymer-forming cytoskeletal protein [Ignavibacteriaceae bacterium]